MYPILDDHAPQGPVGSIHQARCLARAVLALLCWSESDSEPQTTSSLSGTESLLPQRHLLLGKGINRMFSQATEMPMSLPVTVPRTLPWQLLTTHSRVSSPHLSIHHTCLFLKGVSVVLGLGSGRCLRILDHRCLSTTSDRVPRAPLPQLCQWLIYPRCNLGDPDGSIRSVVHLERAIPAKDIRPDVRTREIRVCHVQHALIKGSPAYTLERTGGGVHPLARRGAQWIRHRPLHFPR